MEAIAKEWREAQGGVSPQGCRTHHTHDPIQVQGSGAVVQGCTTAPRVFLRVLLRG